MQSMLFPFFVLFPLMKAVTTPAIDKLLSVNATVSFGRFSAVPVEGNSSQTATMIDGYGLQIEEGKKGSVNAAERKHFKGLAIFPDDPGIWPGGIVPYQLLKKFNSTEKAVISYGMNEFHKQTCITFRKRKRGDMYFLGISGIPRKWCYSHVGRDTETRAKDGSFMTELNMDPECFDGPAMIHELMHSIGFHHEHHREDRDPRIDETPRNPDPQEDFQNRGVYTRSEAYYMGEYDTESVMHYDFDHFKPYIRTYFTQADIDNINTLYKCDRITKRNFAKKAMSNKRGRKNFSLDATQKNSAKNNVNAMPRKSGVQVSKTVKNALNTNNPTKWNGAPTNAPRMIWSPTKGYFAGNDAIRKSTAFVRDNMNAKNNLKGNFMRTGNTAWTKATRNPRNVPKTNFITWRPTSPNRRYFAGNVVVTNNAASGRYYTPNRYTLGKNAIGTNAPSPTSVEKNPRNTAAKSPVSRGSNKPYERYLAGNSATGTYTPSTRNNMNNKINRYLENNAATNNAASGRYYTANRYTLGKNAIGTNAPSPTSVEKNPRNTAAKSPVSRGSNKPYERYLAGNSATGGYTPPTRNNMNNKINRYLENNAATNNAASGRYYTANRYTLGKNAIGTNAPSPTSVEKNSGNAAGKSLVSRGSNNPYGRYLAGNSAAVRYTPSTKNNMNNRINRYLENNAATNNAANGKNYVTNRYPLGKNVMGTNASSRTYVVKNSKNAAGESPVSQGFNKLYGRYLAGNSATGRYTPSTKNNMNNRINRYLENNAATNNSANGKNYVTNRYPLGKNVMGTNASSRTYVVKNSKNAAGESPVSQGSNKLYGRYLAGNSATGRYTPSTKNNMNNSLYRYFAGNNAMAKNTAFGSYYTTNRYTVGRNVGTNVPSLTHTETNPKNAAGKKPVNWRSNILYGRYFGGNRAIGRTTPSTRNNINNKINPTITTKGWNKATLSNFKRNLRDSARNNPVGRSSNSFNGRYFAGSNAMKNNQPLGRINMISRNTHTRYAMGRNYADWTKPNRYPKNAAGRDRVMRSSNYLYKSHLPLNKVIRRDTPPLGYNMNARSITRRNSAGTDRGPWNGANRNPKAAGRNPVMRSSNYLYRSHLPRNKVLRRDTPPSRNNMNARSTTRRNSAGTDRGARNGANRNPKAAGRNPLKRSSNNLYRNYFASNNTTRNSRPFRKNNMNERNNQKRNDTMNNRNTGRRNRTSRNTARSRFTGTRRNVRENMK